MVLERSWLWMLWRRKMKTRSEVLMPRKAFLMEHRDMTS